ncbi:MAG: HNH endonuclease signature motif containing protein [Prevotella sp.]|nr:HNH endonuclease signature motif containing protein [Prevotella sp.]
MPLFFLELKRWLLILVSKASVPSAASISSLKRWRGDHITPWSQGGHTTPDNLQMLCKNCNRLKSDK